MIRRFPRTPWRDTYEESQTLRARHGRFSKPTSPASLRADVRKRMEDAERRALEGGQLRPVWHFRAEEVARIDFDDDGGVLFELRDGRVFDAIGDRR